MRVPVVSSYQQSLRYYDNKNRDALCLKSPLPCDMFIKQSSISFCSEYNRTDVFDVLTQIEQGNKKSDGQGYQSAFYKINDNVGIKAPSPIYPNSPSADKLGNNNRKEFLTLNKVKNINQEIAVTPLDLIEYNDKAYLVIDFVQGKHPIETKLTKQALDDLAKKCYELDINGIQHCDLQSGNIFIKQDKVKFIDFASNNILLDNGRYISSDDFPVNIFENFMRNQTNSPKENRFLATFSKDTGILDLKNSSDNFNLKIKSNVSNLEFRLIYDYINQNKENNPKEILKNYLQSKSENYHKKMLSFLKSLEVSQNDTELTEQIKKAISVEKLFIEIFANPSEDVLKTELSKMQLKWLINDNQGNKNKAYNYLISLQDAINGQVVKATGSEKNYFLHMQELLKPYKDILESSKYKGAKLEDCDDLVKTIFDKNKLPIKPPNDNGRGTCNKNKKTCIIASITAALAGGVYLYKKNQKTKND